MRSALHTRKTHRKTAMPQSAQLGMSAYKQTPMALAATSPASLANPRSALVFMSSSTETPDPGVLESQTQESAEPENNVAVTAGPAFAVDLDHDQAQPPQPPRCSFVARERRRASWGL